NPRRQRGADASGADDEDEHGRILTPGLSLRRRREQHPARRLPQHVLGHLPDLRRPRRTDPAEDRASPHPGRRLTAHHDRLRPPPARRLHDPRPHASGRKDLRPHLDRLAPPPPLPLPPAPRRRPASTIPAPTLRAGRISVLTSTDSYSSPTSFARRSAASAFSTSSRGGGASGGPVSGLGIPYTTPRCGPVPPGESGSAASANRPAVPTMSSSSRVPKIGTRIALYSPSGLPFLSASAGT